MIRGNGRGGRGKEIEIVGEIIGEIEIGEIDGGIVIEEIDGMMGRGEGEGRSGFLWGEGLGHVLSFWFWMIFFLDEIFFKGEIGRNGDLIIVVFLGAFL